MGLEIGRYTYASLVDEGMNRKKHSNCRVEYSITNTPDFAQTKSLEEAHDFAINGWDLGLKEFKVEDGVLESGATEMQPSLAGVIPHIQNHIMGFPEEMYQLYDMREYNLPTLDIVVNLAYLGWVDGSDALRFSKCLVGYINAMASTRNIRLTGVFATTQSGSREVYDFVTLKDLDSTLVINNVAFAFHPSFFRRFWFGVVEGREYWNSGYGGTIDNYVKIAKKELAGGESDETLFFKSLSSNGGVYDWDIEDIPRITF